MNKINEEIGQNLDKDSRNRKVIRRERERERF